MSLHGSSLRVQIFGGRLIGTCFLEQYFLFLPQAFRYMSHKFHGKASGKMKSEKRNKKHQEEMVSYLRKTSHCINTEPSSFTKEMQLPSYHSLLPIKGDEEQAMA